MSNVEIREFRLTASGSARGVSCDASGAFVCGVPLLKQVRGARDTVAWESRNTADLSAELSYVYGLPIDFSSKARGLSALAKRLNNRQIAQAQLVALLMQFPDAEPQPTTPEYSRARFIGLIRSLHASGLLKAEWDSDLHPRWPAGASDSQGGRFAPKGDGDEFFTAPSSTSEASHNLWAQAGVSPKYDEAALSGIYPENEPDRADTSADGSAMSDLFEPVVYRGVFHDQIVAELADQLRARGLKVVTEVPLFMADGSGNARIDMLVKGPITFGIEVKTGEEPFMTRPQLYVYPHAMMGGSVFSPTPKVGVVGLLPLIPMPPLPIVLYYLRDDYSEPISEELSAEKMLKLYFRRYGSGPAKKWVAIETLEAGL